MAKRAIRPIRIEGNVAYVTLTKGYVAVIDAVDIPLVNGRNWRAQVPKTGPVYAKSGSRTAGVFMHRVILDAPNGMKVDHWDSDGLNNRRKNLRLATNSQNGMNVGLRSDNSSGFKGVGFVTGNNKYRARIRLEGVETHIGCYDTLEEAHAAYWSVAKRLHGEFANAGKRACLGDGSDAEQTR